MDATKRLLNQCWLVHFKIRVNILFQEYICIYCVFHNFKTSLKLKTYCKSNISLLISDELVDANFYFIQE